MFGVKKKKKEDTIYGICFKSFVLGFFFTSHAFNSETFLCISFFLNITAVTQLGFLAAAKTNDWLKYDAGSWHTYRIIPAVFSDEITGFEQFFVLSHER